MTPLRDAGGETNRLVPALARRTIAAVGADVETAPIIDRGDHRRRLGVWAGGQIGCIGLASDGCERDRAERGCNLPVHVCPESINCDVRIYLWMRDKEYQPYRALADFAAL